MAVPNKAPLSGAALNKNDPLLEGLASDVRQRMNSHAMALPSNVDPRVAAFPPNMAIEWGYNLWLIDALPKDSETRRSALLAVAEIEGFLESFPIGSVERMYLTSCRVAATGFARGIDRRKRMLSEELTSAKEKKDYNLRGYAKSIFTGAFLSGGSKMLLVAGFCYALVRAIFEMPVLAKHAGGVNEQYASLATALGLTLISAYLNAWWTGRSLLKMIDHYDEQRTKAEKKYSEEVIMEYRLAAETADNAWFQLTGHRAPVTKAFENLLLGIMRGCVVEAAEKERNGKDES